MNSSEFVPGFAGAKRSSDGNHWLEAGESVDGGFSALAVNGAPPCFTFYSFLRSSPFPSWLSFPSCWQWAALHARSMVACISEFASLEPSRLCPRERNIPIMHHHEPNASLQPCKVWMLMCGGVGGKEGGESCLKCLWAHRPPTTPLLIRSTGRKWDLAVFIMMAILRLYS